MAAVAKCRCGVAAEVGAKCPRCGRVVVEASPAGPDPEPPPAGPSARLLAGVSPTAFLLALLAIGSAVNLALGPFVAAREDADRSARVSVQRLRGDSRGLLESAREADRDRDERAQGARTSWLVLAVALAGLHAGRR